jgi:hypothetical protein
MIHAKKHYKSVIQGQSGKAKEHNYMRAECSIARLSVPNSISNEVIDAYVR